MGLRAVNIGVRLLVLSCPKALGEGHGSPFQPEVKRSHLPIIGWSSPKLKRFFTKSIMLQVTVSGVLALLLVAPAITGYSSHRVLSVVGIGRYLVLMPALGVIIEAKVK